MISQLWNNCKISVRGAGSISLVPVGVYYMGSILKLGSRLELNVSHYRTGEKQSRPVFNPLPITARDFWADFWDLHGLGCGTKLGQQAPSASSAARSSKAESSLRASCYLWCPNYSGGVYHHPSEVKVLQLSSPFHDRNLACHFLSAQIPSTKGVVNLDLALGQ